jgi:hypothetical protein
VAALFVTDSHELMIVTCVSRKVNVSQPPEEPPPNSQTVKLPPAEVEYGVHDKELVLIK